MYKPFLRNIWSATKRSPVLVYFLRACIRNAPPWSVSVFFLFLFFHSFLCFRSFFPPLPFLACAGQTAKCGHRPWVVHRSTTANLWQCCEQSLHRCRRTAVQSSTPFLRGAAASFLCPHRQHRWRTPNFDEGTGCRVSCTRTYMCMAFARHLHGICMHVL